MNEVKQALQEFQDAIDTIDPVESLRVGMKKLPGNQRFIISLYYLDGYSIREISDAINIPQGTVKSRLFHARKHLEFIFNELIK